jgi:hypothetical protein
MAHTITARTLLQGEIAGCLLGWSDTSPRPSLQIWRKWAGCSVPPDLGKVKQSPVAVPDIDTTWPVGESLGWWLERDKPAAVF